MSSRKSDFDVHYTADGVPIFEDKRPMHYYGIHGDALYNQVVIPSDPVIPETFGGINIPMTNEASNRKPKQKTEYKGGKEARKARREEARRAKKQAMKNK